MKLRMNTLKLRDNASDIVVVSDVNRDVMSPVTHGYIQSSYSLSAQTVDDRPVNINQPKAAIVDHTRYWQITRCITYLYVVRTYTPSTVSTNTSSMLVVESA